MTAFEISRTDGRSNQQVVIDHVHAREPGTLFPYDELAEELGKGSERVFDRDAIRNAVTNANRRLLREYQRVLANVRNVGYRLAPASEHSSLALVRRRRADRELVIGLQLLRNVRWDELDPQARQAHAGILVVTEAIYANQRALERRQNEQEHAIRELIARVDRLDPQDGHLA